MTGAVRVWGTIVNVLAIIGGSILGALGGNFLKEGTKDTVTKSVALVVLFIGGQMAFETKHLIVMVISMVLGSVTGEAIGIEKRLNQGAAHLENIFRRGKNEGGLTKGFVTATLIFCIGAMAIMGALQSGLAGEHSILYAKSVMDGVTSIILASTLGFGVALSALSVLIYQGAITLLAGWIEPYIIQEAITEMKAVGGLLIAGIGLNMLGIVQIRIGNMLPTLVCAIILTTLVVRCGWGI